MVQQMANVKALDDFIDCPLWCSRFYKTNKLTARAWTTVGHNLPDVWIEKRVIF